MTFESDDGLRDCHQCWYEKGPAFCDEDGYFTSQYFLNVEL